ncbi:MAG: YihY/virulence factor BrkB family protein [Thermoanaerobaculia bacterium]
MRQQRLSSLFRRTFAAFGEDHAASLGAALAYYVVFAIAPILLIATAVAGRIFGEKAAEGEILQQLGGTVGFTAAKAIQDLVISARASNKGMVATLIGAATFIFAAFGLFSHLKYSIDRIWRVERRKTRGWETAKKRLLSIATVFAVILILLVSLLFDTVAAAVGQYAAQHLTRGEAVWHSLQLMLSVVVVTIVFALLFRFLPGVRVAWHDVWPGALFTAFLFTIGKFVVGLYLGKAAVGASYGGAGSIVVVLVWAYWSSQIFLFGIEFTHVYATAESDAAITAAQAQSAERAVVDR